MSVLKGANSMAVSGLAHDKLLVGARYRPFLDLCVNELRKQSSHLV